MEGQRELRLRSNDSVDPLHALNVLCWAVLAFVLVVSAFVSVWDILQELWRPIAKTPEYMRLKQQEEETYRGW